jgi:hypothetical protein
MTTKSPSGRTKLFVRHYQKGGSMSSIKLSDVSRRRTVSRTELLRDVFFVTLEVCWLWPVSGWPADPHLVGDSIRWPVRGHIIAGSIAAARVRPHLGDADKPARTRRQFRSRISPCVPALIRRLRAAARAGDSEVTIWGTGTPAMVAVVEPRRPSLVAASPSPWWKHSRPGLPLVTRMAAAGRTSNHGFQPAQKMSTIHVSSSIWHAEDQ